MTSNHPIATRVWEPADYLSTGLVHPTLSYLQDFAELVQYADEAKVGYGNSENIEDLQVFLDRASTPFTVRADASFHVMF